MRGNTNNCDTKQNILVFAAASYELVFDFLNEKHMSDDQLYVVIPQKRADGLQRIFPGVRIITGAGDHIDRKQYQGKKELKQKVWDEVWLLSSRSGNCLDFQDCLFVISELEYKVFLFKGGTDSPVICGEKGRFSKETGLKTDFLTESFYNICKLKRRIWDFVFGYRW